MSLNVAQLQTSSVSRFAFCRVVNCLTWCDILPKSRESLLAVQMQMFGCSDLSSRSQREVSFLHVAVL